MNRATRTSNFAGALKRALDMQTNGKWTKKSSNF